MSKIADLIECTAYALIVWMGIAIAAIAVYALTHAA